MNRRTYINNKRGVSMVELLGYIVLVGSVFTLLSSTTFLIARSTRKAYVTNRLNVASTQLYTDLLNSINTLQPERVEIGTDSLSRRTIIFERINKFDENGESVSVSDGEINKYIIYYDSTSNLAKIDVYTKGSNVVSTSSNLSLNASVSFTNFDFTIANETSAVKSVEFSGTISNENETRDFLFSVPVFTVE